MPDNALITSDELLAVWEEQRRLTRRVIERFPEDKLFGFAAAPGMRPFSGLVLEMIGMIEPTLTSIASGDFDWAPPAEQGKPQTKQELLAAWDEAGARLRDLWVRLSPERLRASDSWLGQAPNPNWRKVFYLIENEVHHRGQGYVYLRALGVDPPFFWER